MDYECIKAALPGLEAQIGRIRNKGQRRRTRKELARTMAKVELRAEVARMREAKNLYASPSVVIR